MSRKTTPLDLFHPHWRIQIELIKQFARRNGQLSLDGEVPRRSVNGYRARLDSIKQAALRLAEAKQPEGLVMYEIIRYAVLRWHPVYSDSPTATAAKPERGSEIVTIEWIIDPWAKAAGIPLPDLIGLWQELIDIEQEAEQKRSEGSDKTHFSIGSLVGLKPFIGWLVAMIHRGADEKYFDPAIRVTRMPPDAPVDWLCRSCKMYQSESQLTLGQAEAYVNWCIDERKPPLLRREQDSTTGEIEILLYDDDIPEDYRRQITARDDRLAVQARQGRKVLNSAVEAAK